MEYGRTDANPLTRKARWGLASLALSLLMPSLDTSIANVSLPALAESFRASFHAVQWVVLAYLIAIVSLIVVAGRLGDIVGPRRLFLFGIALFTAASLACGVAPTLALLVAARAVQGLGAAIMMALSVAMVGATIPASRTGSAMGLLGSMSAIGTTLGPTLGGALIAGAGWRMIFLVNIPLGVVNFAMAWRTLPSDAQRTNATRVGPATSALSMFTNSARNASLALTVLVSAALMTTLVVGPFYLARTLGLSNARVGLVMSVGPLAAALAGVPAGRLVDRHGSRSTIIFGLIGMSLGLVALAMTSGVAGYLAAIVVVTTSYALFQTANNTGVMSAVHAGERGVVSGMLSLSRYLGLIGGTTAMGAVFAFVSSSRDVAAGTRASYVAAAILVLLALALAVTTPRATRTRVVEEPAPLSSR